MLLHNGVADRSMWGSALGTLAEHGFRALAVDLPGFGEARVAPGALLAPWEDVLETMTTAGVSRAVLVGNSWGAGMALRAAAVAPERVDGLVLVSAADPWRSEPSTRLAAAWEAEETALANGDVDGAIAAVLEAWVMPGDEDVRARVAEMQRRTLAEHGSADPDYAADPLDAGRHVVAALACPALCLCGEHEMPDFTEAAPMLGALLPQGRSAVIAGAGHLAPLETPGAFEALLLEFLAAL